MTVKFWFNLEEDAFKLKFEFDNGFLQINQKYH